MNRLPSVIGDAPSELDLPELMRRLQLERSRVRQALADFRASPPAGPARKSKKKATPKKKKVKAIAKDKSVDADLLQEAIAMLLKEKGERKADGFKNKQLS